MIPTYNPKITQNTSKFFSRFSSKNHRLRRQQLRSEHHNTARINTNIAGNTLIPTLVNFSLYRKNESNALQQILKLIQNLLKCFPCLHSINLKPRPETKKENLLQLKRKRRSTVPAEVGKNTGKPPLQICDCSCSHNQADLNQIYDSPQNPPKQLIHPCPNNRDQGAEPMPNSSSTL